MEVDSASFIADAWKQAKKLSSKSLSLCLNFNKIADKGASAIAEALKTNSTLEKLLMRRNQISESLQNDIESAMSKTSKKKRRSQRENWKAEQLKPKSIDPEKDNSTKNVSTFPSTSTTTGIDP